jgi:hypothetical protein
MLQRQRRWWYERRLTCFRKLHYLLTGLVVVQSVSLYVDFQMNGEDYSHCINWDLSMVRICRVRNERRGLLPTCIM